MLEGEIQKRLTTQSFGRRIFSFGSIDSTNTFAKSIAHDVEEGTLVIAEEQTSGRGRPGRSWHSDKEKNLTFSIILAPNISPEYAGVLSLYTAVAVAEALQAQARLEVCCKWPNDIMISGKKCCGILSESVLQSGKVSSVVLGIGINVNQRDFPDEIRTSATSLSLEAGRMFDRLDILVAVILKLEEWYRFIRAGEYPQIIDAWKSRAPMMGKTISVNYNGSVMIGIARRLDADGSLMFQSNGREMKLTAGDVSIVREYAT